MTNRLNILNELRDLGSSLIDHSPQNTYEVPHGYFEGFLTHLLNRINASEARDVSAELSILSPFLSSIPKQNPYSVPSGYFDNLEEKLMESLRQNADYLTSQEELTTLSPLLSGLKKGNLYAVPDGYFEDLTNELSIAVSRKSESKVIPLSRRRWFRYATAAVVSGAIVLIGIAYFDKPNTKPVEANKAWAKVEKNVQTLSDKELNDFVQYTDAGLGGNEIVAGKSAPAEDVKDLLKDVSDKEIQQFLDQTTDTEEDPLSMN
jgi:hypothetical protein